MSQIITPDYGDLTVVDFTEQAQCCNVYEEFIEKMAATSETDLGQSVPKNQGIPPRIPGVLLVRQS